VTRIVDLLIDIGNTRIKWATLDENGIGTQSAIAYTTLTREQLINQVLQIARPDRVLVGNVGGARMTALLEDALAHRWGMSATFAESTAEACGVRNAYPEPRKLGVDRWLGVIAAHAIEARATCVVSVGTAMTIDAVTADGSHLGGVIVPGPDLMISSLMRGTSDILSRAADGSIATQLFADNTLGAVHQGAVNALAALIERAIDSLRLSLHVSPAVILTGGACHRVESLVAAPCIVIPDLVLRGLAVLLASPRGEVGAAG
jgi:type III pantothenate kinase